MSVWVTLSILNIDYMKTRLLTTLLLSLLAVCAVAQNIPEPLNYHPEASSDAIVLAGKARFTVLTPRLVRMEWVEDASFEDRATLGVVNRNLDVPEFSVKKSKSKVVIKTSGLTLSYTGQEKFSSENLSVSFTMADPSAKKGIRTVTWTPGMDDYANLLGTVRTLDKFDGTQTREPYDKGVLSRDGWAILDESDRHVFTSVDSDWQYWPECRDKKERQDIYFFGYGHDYTQALGDYVKIAGRIPLPPKYALGYWWSRYWEYSDTELVGLADDFRSYGVPIDVMIIDMDWHETWNEKSRNSTRRHSSNRYGLDEFGERIGWTGYTWKKELFPNPANLMEALHRRDVKTSLNLHFMNGIQPFEEPYDRFVKDYLSRTDNYDGPKDYVYTDKPYVFQSYKESFAVEGQQAPVPFRICQMEWADAYFNSLIRKFDDLGVDFWWLDWQQWRNSKYIPGLNNTFWLNHTFFNDKVRQTASQGIRAPRPLIYHRWGGIGSHRYQVGFSGDTYASWQVLGYLPYFTATASNVGYGYWGHDIGGHMQPKGVNKTDPELYTRWIQSGVFNPIFKTHSSKNMTMEKRFWVFPDHFKAMKDAIRLRYDLSPYIYNAARQAYDTGVSICRPLYYYWPEDDKAYQWKEEFMFGDDILATVVCNPVDKITALAERTMWFPTGTDWYDVSTGVTYKGGTEHTLLYTVEENPYYVKAGAVIPMASPEIMHLQEQYEDIRLFVAPGEGESRAVVYEDDGNSQAYESEYALTEVVKKTENNIVTISVAPRKGTFEGMKDNRRVSVVLECVLPPTSVKVNGKLVPYSRFASFDQKNGEPVWGYDGSKLQTQIWLASTDASQALEIACTFDRPMSEQTAMLSGKKGLFTRMTLITPEAKLRFSQMRIADIQLPAELMAVAQGGSFITEDPENAVKYINALDIDAMNQNLASWEKLSLDFKTRVAAQTKFEK